MRTLFDSLSSKAGALIALCLILGALGCQQEPAPPAATQPAQDIEQDEQAVIDAHKALIRAYEAADIEAFTALLAPSPELLVFHPRLASRFDGLDEVRESMGKMFARFSKATWSDFHALVRVEGNTAWLTSHVQIEAQGLQTPFVGRGTEIWLRRPEGWRLVHGHWSPNPEVQQ